MNKYYSNIFWHFTGSPKNIKWDEVHKPADIIKDAKRKSTGEAWDILKKILDSKILKATCNEKLYGDRETDKFCCVTDIPLMNLHRHKKYYGDVALDLIHQVFMTHLILYYIPQFRALLKRL